MKAAKVEKKERKKENDVREREGGIERAENDAVHD
jgi:hypothetical protein